MKSLFKFFVLLTVIFFFQSCNNNIEEELTKAPSISYEELSFNSFEEAFMIAYGNLIKVMEVRFEDGVSTREDIENQTVENTGWLLEAMSNIELRNPTNQNYVNHKVIEYTVTVDTENGEVEGNDIASAYNDLHAYVSSNLTDGKELVILDVEIDDTNPTSVSFKAKGIMGNVISYFDYCVARDDDYWWPNWESGTCRPNPDDNEFVGLKDASEREQEIINGPYCFGSQTCNNGNASYVLYPLATITVPYSAYNNAHGDLHFSPVYCLTPDDMEHQVDLLRDILLTNNPTPNSRDFAGMSVLDFTYFQNNDIVSAYHYGVSYYAVFGCISTSDLPCLPPC